MIVFDLITFAAMNSVPGLMFTIFLVWALLKLMRWSLLTVASGCESNPIVIPGTFGDIADAIPYIGGVIAVIMLVRCAIFLI